MTSNNAIFSQDFQVRYGEVNQYGELSIHHLFNYLQEIAFNHADVLASSVEGKKHFDLAVVWTRMKIFLETVPKWKENLTISTWISPLQDQQRFAFRNFTISNNNHQNIGYGYGSLLFFDLKQRKAIPVPENVKKYPTNPKNEDKHQFTDIKLQINDTNSPSVKVNFQDVDIYHHVNNVKYIEWAFNHVEKEIFTKYVPTSVQINFQKELRFGETISLQTEYLEELDDLVIYHLIFLEKTKEKIAQLQTIWKKRRNT
jgi:acyl-ACP thioesterase